jgi:hypothetical protein
MQAILRRRSAALGFWLVLIGTIFSANDASAAARNLTCSAITGGSATFNLCRNPNCTTENTSDSINLSGVTAGNVVTFNFTNLQNNRDITFGSLGDGLPSPNPVNVPSNSTATASRTISSSDGVIYNVQVSALANNSDVNYTVSCTVGAASTSVAPGSTAATFIRQHRTSPCRPRFQAHRLSMSAP